MRLAGQSCISVQTIYVHEAVYARFLDLLTGEVRKLRLGDPLDPATDVGTLIDEAAACRVENWVREARGAGARVVTGGRRQGAAFEPTVLTDVEPTMKVVCEEIFGPVINVIAYASRAGVDAINAGPYGLQTESSRVRTK